MVKNGEGDSGGGLRRGGGCWVGGGGCGATEDEEGREVGEGKGDIEGA